MQDRLVITVSDTLGSRYFTLPGFAVSWITGSLVVLVAVVLGSGGAAYFHWLKATQLASRLDGLHADLLAIDAENSRLNKIVAEQGERLGAIGNALVAFERDSSLDTGDGSMSLVDRIGSLAVHYLDRDTAPAYSAAGETGSPGGTVDTVDAGAFHAGLTDLTPSHEKILFDSIPNGFPTRTERVAGPFGTRVQPLTGISTFHKGVDLEIAAPDLVHVTADGIVREASDTRFNGNRVVVQHNYGFETRYSYLGNIDVKPGDIVHKGDILGGAGQTGAPWLHYEIRYLGKAIDPKQFLAWEFGSHEIFTTVRGIKWPSLISLINKQITHQTLQLSQLEPTSSVK